jgi:hypothetical protein
MKILAPLGIVFAVFTAVSATAAPMHAPKQTTIVSDGARVLGVDPDEFIRLQLLRLGDMSNLPD